MRRKINVSILICIIALVLNGVQKVTVNALDSINFNRLTIENGLSQSTALRIYQDSKGYMWIGTTDGLNKYNGKEFQVYKYSNSKENSISSNYIYSIVEDERNNIWVGTANGINKLNVETGNVKVYLPGEVEGTISHSQIEGILMDSKNRMWVCTADGVNIYDSENDSFNRVLFSENEEKSLSNQFAHTITEDNMGRIWIGTPNGLNMYDESLGIIKKFFHDENNINSISSDDICEVYADGDYLWVGTVGGGLNKINLNTFEVKRYVHNSEDKYSLPSNTIRDILKDDKGTLWLATTNGIAKFNEEEEKFISYTAKLYETNGLASNDVLCLYENVDGTIWVGTSNGINIFNNENIFTNYKHDPLNDNSLSSNMSSGIYEDKDDLLWIGTLDAGINVIDRKNNTITRYSHNPEDSNSIPSNYIRDIVGKGNDIWISTNMGLSHYNKSTEKFTNYIDSEGSNGLISNSLRALYIDDDGVLWIGTADGICTLDTEGSFKDYTGFFTASGVKDSTYVEIFQDSEGIMWFGLLGETGLVKYDKNTGEVKSYKNIPGNSQSLSINTIRAINEDGKGDLWIGTAYGLNKFDKATETFTTYTDEDGLANSYIYGVLIDDNDNVWVSTNSGISNLIVSENRIINYDITDGIGSSEMNGYSFYRCHHGDMIFGGVGAITMFNPSQSEIKSYRTRVILESVQTIGGSKYESSGEINLGYKESEIILNFFLPDYRNTSKIEYAYKLEGVDEQWGYAGKSGVARYTNLPAGSYKFLVTARNFRGEWSEVTSIEVNKEVAPWESPVAYFIYILALGSILYLIWNYVKILDNLVLERTRELSNKLEENKRLYDQIIKNEKYKNNYFINLSHELRTPLNVIVSMEQLITSLNESDTGVSREKLTNYMSTLRRNSKRLLNLINNIIDTSKIESGSYRLKVEENDIVFLVEEIALSMVHFSNANNIELIIDPEMEEKIVKCDKKEIEKCVVNLIANAIKFTPSGGIVKVTLCDLGNCVEIRVKDNGIGIDGKFHKAIFDRFGQAYNEATEEHGGSGLGLTLTKHLVELHGGEIKLISTPKKGSEFIIILPVNGPNIDNNAIE